MKNLWAPVRRILSVRARCFVRREFPLFEYASLAMVGQAIGYLLLVYAERSLPGALLIGGLVLLIICRFSPSPLICIAGLVLMVAALPSARIPPSDRPLRAVLRSDPRSKSPGRVELEVSLTSLSDNLSYGSARCRAIHLPWKNVARLRQGDQFILRGRFIPISLPWNPLSYDANMRRHGVSASCTIQSASVSISRAPKVFSLIRAGIFRRITEIFGAGDREGLFLSMVLGYRDLILQDTFSVFQAAGLAHLLVVSGYHVTLLFSSILWGVRYLFGWLLYWQPAVVVSALSVAVVGTIIFVALIGVDSANMRASAATAVVAGSMISERGGGLMQGMIVALLFLMVVWPGCFFEPGVQLTFAALIGIAYGLSLSLRFSWQRYLAVLVAPSLMTLGPTILWFQQASVVGFIANPLLAPIASAFFTIGGLAAMALHFLTIDPHAWALAAVLWVLGYFRDLVYVVGTMPFASVAVEGISTYVVGGGVVLISVALILNRLDDYLSEMGIVSR